MEVNNIEMIARAHQLVMEGYKLMFDEKVVTVWSAPNYCYRCGNVAAILELNENLERNYKIFNAAPQVHFLLISRHQDLFQLKSPFLIIFSSNKMIASVQFSLYR